MQQARLPDHVFTGSELAQRPPCIAQHTAMNGGVRDVSEAMNVEAEDMRTGAFGTVEQLNCRTDLATRSPDLTVVGELVGEAAPK